MSCFICTERPRIYALSYLADSADDRRPA